MNWPAKLSFNDMVAYPRPLDELLTAAQKAGVTGLGLHIHLIENYGFEKAKQLIRDSGITVTNYSAVGFWVAGMDYSGRPRTLEDTIRNLDQAAELGTDLVGVVGGRITPGDKDLEGARQRIIEGIAELLPYAAERNIRLAIEPTHPMFSGNGPVIPTLRYTLDIIDEVGAPPHLGVLLDTYHVWWEPDLAEQVRRAGDRVFMLQISDWSPEMASKNARHRAMMGEGCIDFGVFLDNLPDFDGWYDNEVINEVRLPQVPLPELLDWIGKSSADTLGIA